MGMSPLKRLKQHFWKFIYPVFPHIERYFLFAHKKNRQRFHIGWLPEGKTLHQMMDHLSTHYGFGNHFVAWEDTDQVLSWRKLVGFEYQYHLRVFADGEIRGHYERTPEASPVDHFLEKGEQAKIKDFLRFLGPYVSSERYLQHPLLKPVHPKKSEITFSPSQGE
jgi:hypothetical protein